MFDVEITMIQPTDISGRIGQAAQTIANQAAELGFDLDDCQVAMTGSAYLTLSRYNADDDDYDSWLVRVADHDANEARYIARVNREPEFDCEPGFQASVVRELAELAGVDPSTLPYIKRFATLNRRASRRAGQRSATPQPLPYRPSAESLAEDSRKAAHFATLSGKCRKNYRYRHADALRRAGAL
ncbi:MAG TPA: hypothetical protein VMY37_07590, partial [Thermoguttaceae bacterium]|nr:hypothetical protein [Thermoguttaceae bacterium]